MSKTNFEFLDALGQIARDKGISVETLLDALANALVAAYKRRPDAAEEAVVTIDPDSGEIRVYGQELNEDGEVVREWDDTPDDFGRIAAQTAKQVILQRIREVERDMKYEEYAGREGDIVTGIVQQTDNRYTLLDLGKVEALLPQAEQVSYERYEHGARLKAYIVEVRKTTKGPQIVVSRTHPGLIKRLFELEVPEIGSGVVEIKAAAREPGHRTKIAVWSNDPNVDPVGACVGARGSRVRMVTNELRGERVDVVPFSDDPVESHPERAGPGPGARGAPRRGDRHRHRHRERLPALPRHRQGGAERPAGRPPHRVAHRHQERDATGRGRGRLRRPGVGRGRVGRGRERRPGLEAGRGWGGHVGRGVVPPGGGPSEAPAAEAGEAGSGRACSGAAERPSAAEPSPHRPRPAWRSQWPWPRCPRRPSHNADTDLCRLPESPASRPADPDRPVAGRGAVGGPPGGRAGGVAVHGVAGLPGRCGAQARLRAGVRRPRRGRRPAAVACTAG